MRISQLLTISFLILCQFSFGQEDQDTELPIGLRVKRDGKDYIIYTDENLTPDTNDFRKLNSRVYFRVLDFPAKKIKGMDYQLISIPGEKKTDTCHVKERQSRSGESITSKDFDKNFWAPASVINKYSEKEHYRYANDVFSGLLTAPFKLRLKTGSTEQSFLDGDFNIAPFIGWKCRLSARKDNFIAPFGFAGITTLKYTSANNLQITDATITENGNGITYGMGVSFRFGDICPGFIIGWDNGLSNLGRSFAYNDKAWISFSINYDFFKAHEDSKFGKQNIQ